MSTPANKRAGRRTHLYLQHPARNRAAAIATCLALCRAGAAWRSITAPTRLSQRERTAQRETPHVGISWLVQTAEDEARLLAAGCPLDQAEPYGDCLTYGPGHYETWAQWGRDKTVDPALRRGDALSSTGRAICSSCTPIASS
jgi:hypothetical protein